MSGKDANTMKKHIGRFLSVLLCLQLLFGMIPLPGLDEHDHDHEHVLGGIVLPVNAWDTTSECEFCNAFIADDYICDCGEGGDHCRLRAAGAAMRTTTVVPATKAWVQITFATTAERSARTARATTGAPTVICAATVPLSAKAATAA